MLQWYQFDGWICTHRINPFYRGKVKLCKMCKIDYETIQEFLSFSFHYNNMDLLVDRAAEVLKNPIAVFDKNYYTVSYSDTTDVQDEERSEDTVFLNMRLCSMGWRVCGELRCPFKSLMTGGPIGGEYVL